MGRRVESEKAVTAFSHPISIALAIPHTPWVPERVDSYQRLYADLLVGENKDRGCGGTPFAFCTFQERESNRVWSQKLFRWALESGASHLLQLQDDAMVAPRFWSILRAMIEAQPTRIIGLEATHPLTPVQHRAGRRWYRDHWLIGVGYVIPCWQLERYVEWCERHPERVAKTNEDSLLSEWSYEDGVDIWHPIPTIIDHDIGLPSTYKNDGHYEYSMYRRPLVTWRDVDSPALEDAAYWRVTEEGAPKLPGPGTQLCWFCSQAPGPITSPVTGARLCKACLAKCVNAVLGGA